MRYFQGNLTEVAIYTNALTPAQVLEPFLCGRIRHFIQQLNSDHHAQPQPQSAFVGGTVTFSVAVVSALLTTNQWFKNGGPLTGKTNSTLILTNVGGADVANYSVGWATTMELPTVFRPV